jgi:hypothetical protein
VGGGQVTYSDFIDDLAQRIDSLSPRSKAAVFWLFGYGLLAALEAPAEWANWFASARELGYRFVTTGESEHEASSLWAQAGTPTDIESSQLLNSAVICLSTPLGIALDPNLVVGCWAEHAFFPLLQSVSLELFDDVVFPGDDQDLDEIFATSRFQVAAKFVLYVVAQMAMTSAPDVPMLDRLLDGARVLAPSAGPTG